MLALGCCMAHSYLSVRRKNVVFWLRTPILGNLILPSPPVPSTIHPGDVFWSLTTKLLSRVMYPCTFESQLLFVALLLGIQWPGGLFAGNWTRHLGPRGMHCMWNNCDQAPLPRWQVAVWGNRSPTWDHGVIVTITSLENCRTVGILETRGWSNLITSFYSCR